MQYFTAPAMIFGASFSAFLTVSNAQAHGQHFPTGPYISVGSLDNWEQSQRAQPQKALPQQQRTAPDLVPVQRAYLHSNGYEYPEPEPVTARHMPALPAPTAMVMAEASLASATLAAVAPRFQFGGQEERREHSTGSWAKQGAQRFGTKPFIRAFLSPIPYVGWGIIAYEVVTFDW